MSARAAACVLSLLASGATIAADPRQSGGKSGHVADRFTAADTDGDGRLSRADAARGMKRVASRFDVLDADRDGHVSRAELAAAQRSPRKPSRSAAQQEAAGLAKAFAAADTDGDGGLTPGEVRTGLPRLADKFARVDADGDRRITLAELRAWVGTRRAAAQAVK